jgi:hypothetical protein
MIDRSGLLANADIAAGTVTEAPWSPPWASMAMLIATILFLNLL